MTHFTDKDFAVTVFHESLINMVFLNHLIYIDGNKSRGRRGNT